MVKWKCPKIEFFKINFDGASKGNTGKLVEVVFLELVKAKFSSLTQNHVELQLTTIQRLGHFL